MTSKTADQRIGYSTPSITVPADQKPSLKKFSALLRITTASGARLDYDFTSKIATPQKTLTGAFAELARFGAICGWQDDLRAAMEDAFARVAEWETAKASEAA